MSTTSTARREYEGIPLFSYGFRPFFLFGALAAAIVPAITILSFSGLFEIEPSVGMIAYHTHEMIFGYLGAIIAGFLLTAVPNWTGSYPVLGWRLIILFSLWVLGRLVMIMPETFSHWSDLIFESLFLFVLAGVIAREIITGQNWRNLPIFVLVTIFALSNLSWHLAQTGWGGSQFSYKLALGAAILLLTIIGGRITPSFTKNWLRKQGEPVLDQQFVWLDKVTIILTAFSCIAWSFGFSTLLTGVSFAFVSIIHLIRLVQWQGWRTFKEPLVLILHIGYLWLPISLALLALAHLELTLVPESAAIHALTTGGIGVMTLAVMTRATLGHTGRTLTADWLTVLIYLGINFAALLRVGASLMPALQMPLLTISSFIWAGAFIIFTCTYGNYLVAKKL